MDLLETGELLQAITPEGDVIEYGHHAADRAALAEQEADLARCNADLEPLGPVNVLAAKEYYDEQLERDEFLNAHSRDIGDSGRSTA